MSYDDDDLIAALKAAGFLLLIGGGVYLVIKAFGAFKNGDKVTREEIIVSQAEEKEDYGGVETIISGYAHVVYTRTRGDHCDACGTEEPERCRKGHCMTCVGNETSGDGKCAICGGCLSNRCYGWDGANWCLVCSD